MRAANRDMASPRDPVLIERQIRDGIASGIADFSFPQQGSNSNVRRVKFNTGTWAIEKNVTYEPLARQEFLSSLVGQYLPAPVPVAVPTSRFQVYLEVMPGRTALEEFQDSHPTKASREELDAFIAGFVQTKSGLAVGLYDAVINNMDRPWIKTSNWLVDDNEVTGAIDNSIIDFKEGPEGEQPGTREPGDGAISSVFAKHWFVEQVDSGQYRWKSNPLHPGDVEDWLSSLQDLKSEFESPGYHDWWRGIIGRLYAIQIHAEGTQRWNQQQVRGNSLSSARVAERRSAHSPSPRRGR